MTEIIYMGMDVQVRRNCCFALINDAGGLIKSGWFSNPAVDALNLIKELSNYCRVAVGIDAPRMPLPSERKWFWNGAKRKWTPRKGQKGRGRHCEIVISAHKLGNPQWSPLQDQVPEWMALGFQIFSALEGLAPVYEVFPTATYHLLQGNTDIRVDVDFASCKPGPKDMLDSWAAAATVREYSEGRGFEVGGGDGLGTIILPRPLPDPIIEEVLDWPK